MKTRRDINTLGGHAYYKIPSCTGRGRDHEHRPELDMWRRGWFQIHDTVFEGRMIYQDMVNALFKDMLVLQIRRSKTPRIKEYLAVHPTFDIVPMGSSVPYYTATTREERTTPFPS